MDFNYYADGLPGCGVMFHCYFIFYLLFLQLIATSTSSCENYPSEIAKPEDFEQAAEARQSSIEAAVALIKQEVEPALTNQDPTQQEEVDTILM